MLEEGVHNSTWASIEKVVINQCIRIQRTEEYASGSDEA